jgi:hypothetical protein
MRFKVHTIARYGDVSDRRYLRMLGKYYAHLASIDFTKAGSLLKYFGGFFIHDSALGSFEIDAAIRQARIVFFRDNDREDINTYRKGIGMRSISLKQYVAKPVYYEAVFSGISRFTADEVSFKNRMIMDSEIAYHASEKKFRVEVSFAKDVGFSFNCTKCTVIGVNPQRIGVLCPGRSTIPYCDTCRSSLLTKSKIIGALKDFDKRSRKLA